MGTMGNGLVAYANRNMGLVAFAAMALVALVLLLSRDGEAQRREDLPPLPVLRHSGDDRTSSASSAAATTSHGAPPFGQGITMLNLVPRYTALYEKYVKELWELHGAVRDMCARIACLTDDMELEATYMRVREAQPSVVWEISPHFGYSTFAILTALRRNGKGVLLSFDLEDDVSANLPAELTQGGRWQLVVGDFSKTYTAYSAQRPDYLFLDSMHTAAFGSFYTLSLIPWLGERHIFASLHDVYNPQFWSDTQLRRDPTVYPDWMPNEEGMVMIDWLKDQPNSCSFYTLSAKRNPSQEALFVTLKAMRDRIVGAEVGLGKNHNPTLFFELNCPPRIY